MSLSITVLFFASAREAAGNETSTKLELPNATDTTKLRQILAEKYPKLASMVLDEENLTFALNEEYVTENETLKDGDVVALIPPISGG
mmetsp:Transcript_4914/g.6857  ORF Transcript_4914/g.6857 Transcript_4914/m.6857 type:complete len:88 (-) Transcript_4914:1059-1322(-)